MRAIKKDDLENVIFYQVPKWLMELFIKGFISQGAFKTYVLMFDRVRLSSKNNWIDDNEDVYIKYSYDEMQKDLDCSRQAISNNLKDLVNCNLIDKKRQFNSSTIFYLNISSVENFTSQEKLTNDSKENFTNASQENLTNNSLENLTNNSLENLDSSKNNLNKNNLNKNNINKIDSINQSNFDNDKVEFRKNFREYISIVSKSTGADIFRIENVIQPSLFKDIEIKEVIEKIKESDFLQGLKEEKPKIGNFTTKNMLNRILVDSYKNKNTAKEKTLDGMLKGIV